MGKQPNKITNHNDKMASPSRIETIKSCEQVVESNLLVSALKKPKNLLLGFFGIFRNRRFSRSGGAGPLLPSVVLLRLRRRLSQKPKSQKTMHRFLTPKTASCFRHCFSALKMINHFQHDPRQVPSKNLLASNSSNNKLLMPINSSAFTLVETAVSVFIFLTAVAIGIIAYINLLQAYAISQNVYASLENLNLGLENIWREIKYGSDFRIVDQSASVLMFKDILCKNITIRLNQSNGVIEYTKAGATHSLNDPALVFVKNLNFLIPDKAVAVTVSLLALAKARNIEVPINLQISAAALNAPFQIGPCQE
jgi:hypothetical protein